MGTSTRPRVAAKSDERVTALELFFDLVFVYALTQVTALLAAHLHGRGLLQGMVVLALVWWSWVGYSWLGNLISADEGIARVVFITVMAAVFIASLAIPEAFDDAPGGFSGPLVLAACYAVVRYCHIGLFAYAAGLSGDRGLARTLLRFGAVATASVVLMFVGAASGGTTQLVLWTGAVTVDYVGTQLIGAGGWRLYAPRHFSERHALIIIIALGESLVSIGVGASQQPVAGPLIIAATLGIVLCAMLWWVYFDVTALAAEHRLAGTEGVERNALARDAYSYLHLPMIAGIVMMALGLKKSLGYVSGSDGHSWGDAMHGLAQWSLHAGPALYLIALVLFRYRNVRTLGRSRPIAAAILLATIPAGAAIATLWDLTLVTAILVALVGFEAIRFRETRNHIRYGHEHTEPQA